jgi:RNA polymerase sigma factor (sigma-70 family)
MHDDDDARAWGALEQRVRGWASAAFARQAWHTVEDVVADTCSAVSLTLDRARGPDTFGGFTYGCYLNARKRAFRASSRRHWTGLDDLLAPAPEEDDHPSANDVARLRGALDSLPPRERQAVILRYFEEQSGAGIAAKLGVSQVNARRIVGKGLARLRQAMLPSGDPSG